MTIQDSDWAHTPSGLMIPNSDGGVQVRKGLLSQVLGEGRYDVEHWRDGKLLSKESCKNLVVAQGLNYLLASALAGGSQITSWYLALFTGNYTVLATDVASGIASNASELAATYYTAGARQAWTANSSTVTGASTSNSSSQASFTFQNIVSPPTTIYGAFLVSSATAVGTGGTLFSGAQFATSKGVASGDILLLTYTYTAATA